MDFPFKDYYDLLAGNYTNCKKEIKNLSKNLPKMKNYCRIIMIFSNNNSLTTILKKISEDESEKVNDSETVHYLPHCSVIKEERETTKVRVVIRCKF